MKHVLAALALPGLSACAIETGPDGVSFDKLGAMR